MKRKTIEEIEEYLSKDEYGLYIYASNYAKCKASIIVSSLINPNDS